MVDHEEKMKPLVSIVVRTKDRPKLLVRALESITAQTYRPVEVVLVNDGGCELDAGEITRILGDVSLSYLRLQESRGRAAAANCGIRRATGEYVGFLDDDDEFLPDHLDTVVPVLNGRGFAVAYSDSVMSYKEYDSLTATYIDVSQEVLFSRDFDFDLLVFENYIPFMCLLFRREVLVECGGLDESFDLYEDWDLLIRVGERHAFSHVRKTTARYNQWAGERQIAQRNPDTAFVESANIRVLKKHRDRITEERVRHYVSLTAEARLAARGATTKIASLEEGIRGRDEKIALLGQMVDDLRRAVSKAQDEARTIESRLREAEEELSLSRETLRHIYDSHGWKALTAYYKTRDKILPMNSKRRLWTKMVLMAARDPRGFLKGASRANLRKFMVQYKSVEPSVLEGKVRRKTMPSAWSGQRNSNLPGNAGDDGSTASLVYGDEAFLKDVERMSHPVQADRILVIDWMVPTHDRDSGSLRMYSLLSILSSEGYRVTFIPDDLQFAEPYTSDLRRLGVEILRSDAEIREYLEKKGSLFSFVVLSRPEPAFAYLPLVRAYCVNSIVVYDTVDLHWVRFARAAATTGNREYERNASHFRAVELFNSTCSDMIWTITNEERDVLLTEDPGLRIEVVPNIHEVAPIGTVFEQRRDILFVGGFLHQPNEDAVIFFVREIFPLIRQRLGDVRFFVVGSNPPPHVLALNSEVVVVTGYVKDLLPYFGSSRVFVCPLRYGAGMKGKIGQSMSFGMPVVTTSVGAEGMELVDGDTALIADGPAAFADAVARLYTDEELWARIAQRSLDHIREKYSREAVRGKIRKILGCIAREPDLLSLRGHE